MYCANCGKSVNENLNYCNTCGARIEKNALQISNSASPALSKSAGFVGIAGLFGFIGVLKMLLDNHVDITAIVIILLAYLVTIFLLCAMMVGHVWKNSGDIRIKTNAPDDIPAPNQFRAENTAQLEEARQQPISVTEHTTRTLDKIESKTNF